MRFTVILLRTLGALSFFPPLLTAQESSHGTAGLPQVPSTAPAPAPAPPSAHADQWIVEGVVTYANGEPVQGKTIIVADVDEKGDTILIKVDAHSRYRGYAGHGDTGKDGRFAITVDKSYFDPRKDKDHIRFTLLIAGTHDAGTELSIPGQGMVWGPRIYVTSYSGITDGNKGKVSFQIEDKADGGDQVRRIDLNKIVGPITVQ
jgi:hypothetical protein